MLGGLGDFFGGILEAILGIPEAIGGFFTTLLTGITDFFKDPIKAIGDFFQWIKDFFSGVFEALIDCFKFVFVPSDDFFSDKIDGLNTTLQSRIKTQDYEELLHSLQYASRARSGLPNLTVTIMGQTATIVDFSYYTKYQDTIYSWVRGLVMVLLVFYNFNNVYKLIRTDSMSQATGQVNHKGGKG